jgi:hypothetical protein
MNKEDRELAEYSNWVWSDTARLALQAVAIYAALLGAYWLTIG